MPAQVVLGEVDVALNVGKQLFEPLLTVLEGSLAADVGKEMAFAELTGFHELLETGTEGIVGHNGKGTPGMLNVLLGAMKVMELEAAA